MRIHLLQSLIALTLCQTVSIAYGQDKYNQIRSELTAWDPVRGAWLADSYEALEKGHAVPDRLFEEDLTPAELFQLAPEQTRKSIQSIIANNPETTTTIAQVPSVTPSISPDGIQRVALEDRNGNSNTNTSTNPRTVQTQGNYNGIFRNANCTLVQGRSYGDPHVRTFDGSTFSFQTVGEYILARSRDGQFEVQARQQAETDKVSLNSAVAMNVAGDQVGIYAQNTPNRASSPIRVNGQSVFMDQGTYYLPSGGTIQVSGKKYVVTWPTGERVQADMISSSGRRFVNLSVFVYNCYGDYYGILGNANGNRNDDFIANGRNMSSGIAFDPFDSRAFDSRAARAEREQLNFLARDFGGQFLVNDRTTLFEYDFGYSSWSFVDPTFPRVHLTMTDISAAQRERARQECIRQGIARDELSACIMDFSHANMAPTPRPTVPDRVSGRSTAPVDNPRPNVNRREAGGGQGVRTPWEVRTGDSNNGRSSGSESRSNDTERMRQPVEDLRTPERSTESIRRGGETTPANRDNTPINETRPVGTVKPAAGRPVYERRTLEDNSTPVRETTTKPNTSANPRTPGSTNTTLKPNSAPTRATDGTSTSAPSNSTNVSKPSSASVPARTSTTQPVRTSTPARTGEVKTPSTSPSPRSSTSSPSSGSSRSGGSVGGSTSGGRR